MIVAVFAAIILLFPGCKNDISVVKSLTIKEKSPVESGKGMHMYYSQNASVRNELFFEELNTYTAPENYKEYPKGVKIISYDENEEKEMSLTANYAIDYEDRKFMEAKYNVVITNFEKGDIIETEHLIWDMNKKMIYSQTQTKQIKPDGSVYIGTGFESNESFTKYSVFNPVIVQYADDE
jgi:LPS export ABC transporter protein LptC